MKHIYIFNTDSQAGDYGIGTYLRELKACLRSDPEIILTKRIFSGRNGRSEVY